ncbi:transposase IS4 family protein, partial [mine drainage metagenome]
GFEQYRKATRRDVFLAEMDRGGAVGGAVRGDRAALPKDPAPGAGGRRAVGLERMLRIHFLQQWYALSDPAVEEALYDSAAMRRFVGIDLGREGAPDETTVCKFRHLLEKHGLAEQLFAAVSEHLKRHGMKLSQGTIVDCDDHRGATLDEEQGQVARYRDAPDEEGQPVVLRHEGAHRRG